VAAERPSKDDLPRPSPFEARPVAEHLRVTENVSHARLPLVSERRFQPEVIEPVHRPDVDAPFVAALQHVERHDRAGRA